MVEAGPPQSAWTLDSSWFVQSKKRDRDLMPSEDGEAVRKETVNAAQERKKRST